ncbi:type II secretion system minor pseudopilin GspI [Uliginosibacterium gangwonense]|uniref:type II secretion system minor pseudopilin GspI n=1 Tax=Uliginosibacterium gangwonense TaxID=392736 RepID=UPI00037068A7|nr:type II secretion system minor pseudopilin GspI [Uliginosibacterium gangwonense]
MNTPFKHGKGFTLLEVLVALAIMAIALTAAMRAIGVASNQTEDIRNRMLAEWVAENRIAEYRAFARWVEPGNNNGEVEQGGVQFHYEENIKGTSNQLFRRIDVTVTKAGDSSRLASVTGFISRQANQ